VGGGQAGSAEQGSVPDIEGLAGPARAEAMLKRAYGEELFDRDATAFLEVRGTRAPRAAARARAFVCVCTCHECARLATSFFLFSPAFLAARRRARGKTRSLF
jgi:hypothetical protein